MKLYRVLLLVSLFVPFSVFAQSADQEVVSVVDSPDPVAPGATLSYTVTVRNNGPDAAVNGGVNINLPLAVTHTTDVVPAGWTCIWSGNNGTCNTPSFAAGATEVLTINTTVGAHLAAFADQSIQANFFPSGTTPDPVNGNNMKTATTQVDSPQVDLSVSATDSPDPVAPDGNVTYNVTVTNGGPDTAGNINFNVVPNSSLRFVSSNQPAGWTCAFPAVGAVNATFTCSRTTWVSGGTDNFVVVFSANDEQFGINDTTFQTNFNLNTSGSNETDHPDNSVTLTTTYQTPDADVTISVADSPDPVAPNGNITYTVTVGNSGPDTAPSITLNSFGGNNLRFQSASVPAGWNCTLPAANAQTAGWSCTLPAGLASGANSVLTFVLQASQDFNGINDGTILFGFSANSTISDPVPANNSETESTAYSTADADVSVAVTDSPDPVTADGNITYTVTVANAGPDAAPNLTLNSFGGNNLRFQSATIPAGWNCTLPAAGTQTTSLTCTMASMASGGSSVLTFVMQADDQLIGNADTTILFGFSANSSVADPDATDNSETESTFYDVANANIGITASDAPDPVAAGSNITYSGVVTNAGPDASSNVSLTIPLDPNLLFVSITPPSGFDCTTPAVGANGTITCTIAMLPSGANLPFTVVAQVNPSANNGPDGIIQQNFILGSSTNDPTGTNNTHQVFTNYTTPDADIVVTNSDSPDPVAPGGTITYTQTITNSGPDTAVNATFAQSVPAGTTFQSLAPAAGWSCTTPAVGAPGSILCSKATMVSGETGAFTLVVNVTANSGSIGSTVVGDSDTYDPDTPDNQATVFTNVIAPDSADLSIAKTTATTNAPAGSTFAYTITVSNAGPNAASNVVVTDTLPAQLTFQSITTPAGFTCTTPALGSTGTITCNGATLANGASAQFTLTVRSNATSGTAVNNASVSSATGDANNAGNSAAAPGVVLGPASADVSIVKTTPSTSAPTGSTITYTITVSNAGPSPATGVVVNDTLPAGLQLVTATSSQGTCNATNPVSCNVGTLNVGANATVTIQALVTATSGTISNTASVTAAEGDADNGDNASTTPPVPVTVPAEGAAIPTLSEWMLMLLAAMLGIVAVLKMRI
jgi:uncharacterized repeat protein (TIGR01451 family)